MGFDDHIQKAGFYLRSHKYSVLQKHSSTDESTSNAHPNRSLDVQQNLVDALLPLVPAACEKK